MARPLRIEYAGALYHVTSRGDRREAIYLSDADRRAWLGILAEVCARFNWRCHSWCQMTNHYHVVIETIEGNLARAGAAACRVCRAAPQTPQNRNARGLRQRRLHHGADRCRIRGALRDGEPHGP